VAWFSMPRAGSLMRRGPPAPVAPMVSTFGLFRLPRGRLRRFFPVLEDPVAVAEEEDPWRRGSFLQC
jgi:hypothetical protein